MLIGMSSSRQRRASHAISWMLKSIVREAFVRSVTWTRPPVSFQRIHESTVPNSRRPCSAFLRASGTLSKIHLIFVAEK